MSELSVIKKPVLMGKSLLVSVNKIFVENLGWSKDSKLVLTVKKVFVDGMERDCLVVFND